jgi:hypothetical protein
MVEADAASGVVRKGDGSEERITGTIVGLLIVQM